MKNIAILFLTMLAAFSMQAQSVLRYEFLNSLNEKNGLGPALTVLGNQGSFVKDTLNEISGTTKTVYRFEENSGVQFNNTAANNFIGTTYSIEIYFVFDELSSWKRVVDWKNRKTDNGAYVYYGQLNFYPYEYSDNAPVEAGEYTYYVVTRDGVSGQVLLYTDADEEISFTDNYTDAVLDADNVLNFFHDDLFVPGEASSGAVALINLYNYVLDSNTVKQNFENIGGQVFGVKDVGKSVAQLKIYPNPAYESTRIEISGMEGQTADLRILNSSGMQIRRESITTGKPALIDTSELPEGLYLVRAEYGQMVYSRKLIVVH